MLLVLWLFEVCIVSAMIITGVVAVAAFVAVAAVVAVVAVVAAVAVVAVVPVVGVFGGVVLMIKCWLNWPLTTRVLLLMFSATREDLHWWFWWQLA